MRSRGRRHSLGPEYSGGKASLVLAKSMIYQPEMTSHYILGQGHKTSE